MAISGSGLYHPPAVVLADLRLCLGDLLLCRAFVGDLVLTLVTTLADEEVGVEDEDRSDLAFRPCLPLSVPDETGRRFREDTWGVNSAGSDTYPKFIPKRFMQTGVRATCCD